MPLSEFKYKTLNIRLIYDFKYLLAKTMRQIFAPDMPFCRDFGKNQQAINRHTMICIVVKEHLLHDD